MYHSKVTRKGILHIEKQYHNHEIIPSVRILSIRYFIGNREIPIVRYSTGVMSFAGYKLPPKDMIKARNEMDRARSVGKQYTNDFMGK